MRPTLKSVGLTLLLVGSTTIALCISTINRSPFLAQSTTTQDRKAEADRLLQQRRQQYYTSQYEAALQSWQQALAIYRAIQDRPGEAGMLTSSLRRKSSHPSVAQSSRLQAGKMPALRLPNFRLAVLV